VRQNSFTKSIFHPFKATLRKYETLMGGHLNLLSLMCHVAEKVWWASLKGCTSPITSKYQILLLLFCEILQQKDTQERYQRTQESYNASLGRWESYTREGSKNSKVTQCTCWVVGFNIFEARALKTSFGKSQMGVVAVARKGCVFWVIL